MDGEGHEFPGSWCTLSLRGWMDGWRDDRRSGASGPPTAFRLVHPRVEGPSSAALRPPAASFSTWKEEAPTTRCSIFSEIDRERFTPAELVTRAARRHPAERHRSPPLPYLSASLQRFFQFLWPEGRELLIFGRGFESRKGELLYVFIFDIFLLLSSLNFFFFLLIFFHLSLQCRFFSKECACSVPKEGNFWTIFGRGFESREGEFLYVFREIRYIPSFDIFPSLSSVDFFRKSARSVSIRRKRITNFWTRIRVEVFIEKFEISPLILS